MRSASGRRESGIDSIAFAQYGNVLIARLRCGDGWRFIFLSKLYRQMYAGTGISSDSARQRKATGTARWIAGILRKLFQSKPMPELQMPVWSIQLRCWASTMQREVHFLSSPRFD